MCATYLFIKRVNLVESIYSFLWKLNVFSWRVSLFICWSIDVHRGVFESENGNFSVAAYDGLVTYGVRSTKAVPRVERTCLWNVRVQVVAAG